MKLNRFFLITSADTTNTRDCLSFGKVIAFGIAAKLSIFTIFLASKFGWLMTNTKSSNTSTLIESTNEFKFSLMVLIGGILIDLYARF